MEKLTADNYYCQKANKGYWSYSQFKSFNRCESCAMAVLEGNYISPKTIPLLVGSYIDSYYEGTLDKFKEDNPLLYTCSDKLRVPFKKADELINKINKDELFLKFLSGEKQKIFTGTLFGVKWKIKIDSYLENKCIVDLKTTYTVKKLPDYRYDIQGAIYQKIVELNTGKRLPFYLAVAEKTKVPGLYIYQITNEVLDLALAEVESKIKHFDAVKKGEIMPASCGICAWCKMTKPTVIKNYTELLEG